MVRQSIAPQTGWFMVPPSHLGRLEDPRGPVWRALGTATVSDLTALDSQSTAMPSTKWPLQNGRHPSYKQPGMCLKERKHREQEQWDSLPSSIASSHRHWSLLQQFIISPLLWLLSGGMVGDTSMLLFNGRCNHYKYSNIAGNLLYALFTTYGSFALYLNTPLSLCSSESYSDCTQLDINIMSLFNRELHLS